MHPQLGCWQAQSDAGGKFLTCSNNKTPFTQVALACENMATDMVSLFFPSVF